MKSAPGSARPRSGTDRRQAMKLGACAAVAALIAPRLAFADQAAVTKELDRLYAGKSFADGKIRLDVPQIAENGLVVPITVEVESPMTDADHVKSVHIFADGNPLPGIASFHFTPACGMAAASTRMRLAQTQNVVCVAEMSDGRLYMAKAEVKVTIGGCGG